MLSLTNDMSAFLKYIVLLQFKYDVELDAPIFGIEYSNVPELSCRYIVPVLYPKYLPSESTENEAAKLADVLPQVAVDT